MHRRPTELEALNPHRVRPAHDLNQHAPRPLVHPEHGTGVAPAQEVDLPGLLEGQLCVDGIDDRPAR